MSEMDFLTSYILKILLLSFKKKKYVETVFSPWWFEVQRKVLKLLTSTTSEMDENYLTKYTHTLTL